MSTGTTRRDSDVVFGSRVRPGIVIAARYRVIEQLGAGGMGQVVLVEHLDLPKRFALKLIRPDRWDETLEARFRREARALARVNSPRVAQVTDFGVDPDLGPFFVMEYVEGATLGALLEAHARLDPERALELAIGLAEALREVHAAGIVHRDIKPGNVAIGAGPIEVRLMDFGLAASLGQGVESRITESRSVVGSMPYMSPEQFGGAAPSPQMDLWALGIVLYEMLHGRLPFEAHSTPALMHQILTQEVPLTPRVGPALEPVFARLLAKDPSQRVETADEAIEVLEDAAAAPREQWESSPNAETVEAIRVDTQRPPPPRVSSGVVPVEPRANKPWWALAAGVALLVVGVAALSWQLGRESGEPVAVENAREESGEASHEERAREERASEERASEERAREERAREERASASEDGESDQVDPGDDEAQAARLLPSEAAQTGGTAPATREAPAILRRPRAAGSAARVTEAAPAEESSANARPDDEGDAWTGGIIETPSE